MSSGVESTADALWSSRRAGESPFSKPALYSALRTGTVAAEMEVALFQHGGGVTAEYKAKFRSLSFNLKDANNPDLRRRVLSREVAAEVPPRP